MLVIFSFAIFCEIGARDNNSENDVMLENNKMSLTWQVAFCRVTKDLIAKQKI